MILLCPLSPSRANFWNDGTTIVKSWITIDAGLVSKNQLVKVLGNGSITVAVEVSAHAFSKTAEEAIVAAGGSVVKIGAPAPENA